MSRRNPPAFTYDLPSTSLPRALTAVFDTTLDPASQQFLVGGSTGDLYLLDYAEHTSLRVRQRYTCPDMFPSLHSLVASPWERSQVIALSHAHSSLCALPTTTFEDGQHEDFHPTQNDPDEVMVLAAFPQERPLLAAMWNPHQSGNLLTADALGLTIWSVDATGASLGSRSTLTFDEDTRPRCLPTALRLATAWDPHHPTQVAVTSPTTDGITLYDVRAGTAVTSLPCQTTSSHEPLHDVDYNPTLPHVLVTGNDAGTLHFWDARHPQRPLKSVMNSRVPGGVTTVRYNPAHAPLVLSGGSKGQVELHRFGSFGEETVTGLTRMMGEKIDTICPSKCWMLAPELLSVEERPQATDATILSYHAHDASVVAVAWGATDSWIFASLSYNGRVVVNTVPTSEKYKILL